MSRWLVRHSALCLPSRLTGQQSIQSHRRLLMASGVKAATQSGSPTEPSSSASSSQRSGVSTAPLGEVVVDAVKRWYTDAHRDALKGDVKQQALLGQMLTEGYGCTADAAAGKDWIDKARRRGYKMSGVYCEI